MTAGGELTNWGRFGPDDELGTLNLIDVAAVLRGSRSVQTGERIRIDLPLDVPDHKAVRRASSGGVASGYRRTAFTIKAEYPTSSPGTHLVVNDDEVSFALQGSSQWDSFAHAGLAVNGEDGVYYNARPDAAVDDNGYAHFNGIDKIAAAGIVSRGVLVDIAGFVNGNSDPLPASFEIKPDLTLDCLNAQKVEVEPGDVMCVRTGWTEAVVAAEPHERIALLGKCPGLSGSHAAIAHEQGWAALAVDNAAVDAQPTTDHESGTHILMMRNLGLPLGELFDFGALAAACRREIRWTFLFCSAPLRIPGGLGSPANALAVR